MSNKSSPIQIHPSIFDNLNSDNELQSIEKLPDRRDISPFSQIFSFIYSNFTSNQVIPGKFLISQCYLAHVSDGGLAFLHNLSYARFYIKISAQSYYTSKILFSKADQVFELAFSEPQELDAFLVEINKICVRTDFRDKYKIINLIEENKKFKEYLIEAHIDSKYYSARVYDKRALLDPQNLKQKRALINEIEALRTLKGHNNFFELHEVHETSRNIYLVTEPMHQGTLYNLLVASAHHLSKPTIQKIMFNIIQALATLSSHGIIHRNIKPANILIEEDENIKIINFGLAVSKSVPLSSLKVCGTPGYLAPELISSGITGMISVDKNDIFAAGCIFFEMLYGYPLFEELHIGSISLNQVTTAGIKQGIFNGISKKANHGDSQSLNLLLKLLEDDPNKRISANEALRHPYFSSLYRENENEKTVVFSKPSNLSPVIQRAHKTFSTVLRTNTSIDSKCFFDEETQDISDEEPEVDTKYQSLNTQVFQKYPSRSSKLSHLLD